MRARHDRNAGGAARTALAWGISVGVHALVIGVMLLVVQVVIPRREQPPIVTVRFDEPGLASPAPARADAATEPVSPPAPAFLAQPPPPAPAPLAPAPESLAGQAPPSVAVAPPPVAAPPPPVRAAAPPEVRFAGIGAGTARDIVYVVDGSGSMISAMPIVLEELERSLRKLESIQSFQIVFFQNDGYVSFPHPDAGHTAVPVTRMVAARRAHLESAIRWAQGVRPSGRSNPIEALEVALSLRPDAIFLLTTDITGADAWTLHQRDEFFARLEALDPLGSNGVRRVPIKTILFLDEDQSGIVREIGARFGEADGFIRKSREDLGL